MTNEAINDGHLLVIPKQHVTYAHEMDEKTYIKTMLLVRKLSVAVKNAFKPSKVGIMVSGWEVPHAHIHVVPMSDPKDITSKKLLDGTAFMLDMDKRQQHADVIKNNLE